MGVFVVCMSLALVLLTSSTLVTYTHMAQAQPRTQSPNPTAANSTTNAGSSSNINSLNKTANVTVGGKNYQVKYSINSGQVLSTVADKTGTKLVLTIQPAGKNGKITIDLPRKLIDYKLAGNKDGSFVVHINGKQNVPINVKEISNNSISRTISIDYGSGDRVIEIIGTQMA